MYQRETRSAARRITVRLFRRDKSFPETVSAFPDSCSTSTVRIRPSSLPNAEDGLWGDAPDAQMEAMAYYKRQQNPLTLEPHTDSRCWCSK